MNDDELDALLREVSTPQPPKDLPSPRKVPMVELLVFGVLALVLLVWAFGSLVQIFGA